MDSLIITNHNLKMRYRIEFTEKGGSFSNAGIVNVSNPRYNSALANGTKFIDLKDFKTLIIIDVPLLLPLKSSSRYDIFIDGQTYNVFHKRKERGEENYSTINTTFLPSFSRLEVLSPGIGLNLDEKDNRFDSYNIKKLILKVITKIIDNLNIGSHNKIGISENIISYEVHYFLANNSLESQPEFSIYVFCDGIIDIKGNNYLLTDHQSDEFKTALLKEQLCIEKFLIENPIKKKDFSCKVDELIHKFLYYCAQHQKSMSLLKEEEIRDLFLVVVKCVFSNGDGEVFNYNGKLDFKITNPDNQFEYISGEFKLWNGEKSFKELMYQGTEKHCTNYETKIYLIVISDKKEIRKIIDKILELLSINEKILYDGNNGLVDLSDPKSRVFFYQTSFESRFDSIPLAVGICDVYFDSK